MSRIESMRMDLVRIAEEKGQTYGVLLFDGRPRFLTIEPPWKDNQRNVSCIPEGEYEVKGVVSPRFGPTLEVMDVPGRDGILFHAGNVAADTRGCILIGERFGKLGMIENSAKAFMMFLSETREIGDIVLGVRKCF